MKRVSQIFFASAKDLATGKRFASRAMVLNTTTGEMRRGPGPWPSMVAPGEGVTADVLATIAVTSNIALAAMDVGETLDGRELEVGDVVFLPAQTNAAQNGLYLVGEESTERHPQYNTYTPHAGTVVGITGGTKADALYLCTSSRTGTIDVTDITYEEAVDGSFAPVPEVPAVPVSEEVLPTDLIRLRNAEGVEKDVTAATLKAYMTAE